MSPNTTNGDGQGPDSGFMLDNVIIMPENITDRIAQ